jgi:hypothetical protein
MLKISSALLAVFVLGLFLSLGLHRLPYTFSSPDPISLDDLSGQYHSLADPAIFHNLLVTPPHFLAQAPSRTLPVLGVNTTEKRIEVDLTNQRLYAFEGDTKVHDFLISSGKWGRTPTGTFNVWIKLRYTKMSGGSKALHTYYYLPNVPYTMYFYNDEIPKSRGFGIHGAYWHDNFGHPMSHGCINMKPEEAGVIYNWASPVVPAGQNMVYTSDDNPSTPIVIYGAAPTN